MYADDTVIFSDTKAGLQKALDSLHRYCTAWKLLVNPSKTKMCVLGNRKYKCDETGFIYNGRTLKLYTHLTILVSCLTLMADFLYVKSIRLTKHQGQCSRYLTREESMICQ